MVEALSGEEWGKAGRGSRPQRAGEKAGEQLKRGGPRRPFVLHHLCAVVLGVQPKERYLCRASQSCGAAPALPPTQGLTHNDRPGTVWQINYLNIWLYEY